MMMLAISLASAFACVPPSQIYRLQVDAQASCINKSALQYATGSLNVATDIFILLMPMRYLFHDAYPVAIWSAVEIDLTIVTASMAASKPFFEKFILSHLKKQISEKLTTPISSKREAGKVNSSSALSAYPHSHPSHASYALEFASLPPTSRRNTLQRDDSSKESLELNFHDILRGSISSSKHETYGSRRGSHTVVEAHEYRKMSLRDVLLDSRISEDGLDGVRKVVSHDGDIDAV
ncbi:MAG: hypothetical protein M1818_001668 [Claussenomyces sp. TS43310]|nr:MAG: hypothetical protein M1818_001668 [Claussenomyces sp. TS43310]